MPTFNNMFEKVYHQAGDRLNTVIYYGDDTYIFLDASSRSIFDNAFPDANVDNVNSPGPDITDVNRFSQRIFNTLHIDKNSNRFLYKPKLNLFLEVFDLNERKPKRLLVVICYDVTDEVIIEHAKECHRLLYDLGFTMDKNIEIESNWEKKRESYKTTNNFGVIKTTFKNVFKNLLQHIYPVDNSNDSATHTQNKDDEDFAILDADRSVFFFEEIGKKLGFHSLHGFLEISDDVNFTTKMLTENKYHTLYATVCAKELEILKLTKKMIMDTDEYRENPEEFAYFLNYLDGGYTRESLTELQKLFPPQTPPATGDIIFHTALFAGVFSGVKQRMQENVYKRIIDDFCSGKGLHYTQSINRDYGACPLPDYQQLDDSEFLRPIPFPVFAKKTGTSIDVMLFPDLTVQGRNPRDPLSSFKGQDNPDYKDTIVIKNSIYTAVKEEIYSSTNSARESSSSMSGSYSAT